MSNLKAIRKERKLTQAELARESGVSIKMIQKYEQGVIDINRAAAETVIKLAMALGVDIAAILNVE